MNFFVNYYISEKRQAEIDECLQRNIENPLIEQIFVLADRFIFFNDPKVILLQLSYRPTFQDFIDLTYASDGINIIANSDIYFDDTLELANEIGKNEVYALSRWELTNEGLKHHNTRDSQDCWIINGNLNTSDCDFTQGLAGCDNAFTERLKWAGYKVSNPSKDIRSIHLHKNPRRDYDVQDRVSLPYLLISPHKLGEEPVLQRLIKPYWK